MQSPSNPRRYTLKSDDMLFVTGQKDNGNQVLMGVQLPELVLVEFDAEGNYLSTSVREMAQEPKRTLHGPYELDKDSLASALAEWQDELGILPVPISVRQFFLSARWIGIKDIPDSLQESLDRPDDYTEEERHELQEELRQWHESGDFVLYWDEEYYLDREGEIVGS